MTTCASAWSVGAAGGVAAAYIQPNSGTNPCTPRNGSSSRSSSSQSRHIRAQQRGAFQPHSSLSSGSSRRGNAAALQSWRWDSVSDDAERSRLSRCVRCAAGQGGKKGVRRYPRGKGKSADGGDSSADAGQPAAESVEEEEAASGAKKASGRMVEVEVKADPPVDGKMMVHVTVPGNMTQATYNTTLREMAKTCPPVPGARMNKGGKTTKVDPSVILRLIGKKRVIGFVLDEIVNSSLATFIDTNAIKAEKKATTTQSADELADAFVPGKPFSFDAELTLLSDADAASASSEGPVVEVAPADSTVTV